MTQLPRSMKLTISIAVLTLLLGAHAHAQSASQSVTNEDRGRACAVFGDTLPLLKAGGKREIPEPHQYSVFVGKTWQTERLHARERELSNLLSADELVGLEVLDTLGWRDLYAPKGYEERPIDVATAGTISDLKIQSILRDVVKGAVPDLSAAGTIVVVYLEPGLSVKLGTMLGGKHFSTYHNEFNRAGKAIRYVVVPYDPSLKTAAERGLAGFVSAVLDPGCSS